MTPAERDVAEALANDEAARAPVDLEQVAADAARTALLSALHGWSLADVAILARAVRLGSPSQLAAGGAQAPLVDEGTEAGSPHGARVMRPPCDEARAAAGHLYRLCGGGR